MEVRGWKQRHGGLDSSWEHKMRERQPVRNCVVPAVTSP